MARVLRVLLVPCCAYAHDFQKAFEDLKSCKFAAKGRKHRHCNCPLAVEGKLHSAMVRRSLDLRSWEAAQKLVRDWEIQGRKPVLVSEACDRFLADRESANLSAAMLGKYRHVVNELKSALGSLALRNVTVDDIRRIKEGWNLSPMTVQKRLERLRKFFSFCVDSEWLDRNPAKRVKLPPAKYEPTLRFTEEEMEEILWAAESIREAHPKISVNTQRKLKALIPLMRYSGIRISDAVMFRREHLKDGRLFLRQEKTKHLVWVPVPKHVVKAVYAVFSDSLDASTSGLRCHFLGRVSTRSMPPTNSASSSWLSTILVTVVEVKHL